VHLLYKFHRRELLLVIRGKAFMQRELS